MAEGRAVAASATIAPTRKSAGGRWRRIAAPGPIACFTMAMLA